MKLIRSHTVQHFLDEGISVVGTVRSKDKGEYLANLFKGSKVPFEYVIVEDIGQVSMICGIQKRS